MRVPSKVKTGSVCFRGWQKCMQLGLPLENLKPLQVIKILLQFTFDGMHVLGTITNSKTTNIQEIFHVRTNGFKYIIYLDTKQIKCSPVARPSSVRGSLSIRCQYEL